MNAPPSSQFSAAVIAGGKSSRFGTDKAVACWDGRRLIDRQLDLLRALGPAGLFVSGRPGVDYQAGGAAVVLDAEPRRGPLGGLAAVLEALTTPHVVLLAVDLPTMTRQFLQGLLLRRRNAVGVVPRGAAGWEPLAAIYPREILPLVTRHLERGDLAMHRLVDAGISAGLLVGSPVGADASDVFRNVNTPDELAP